MKNINKSSEDLQISWQSIFNKKDYFTLYVATGFGAGFYGKYSIFATILRAWAIVLIFSYILDGINSLFFLPSVNILIVWAVGIIFFMRLYNWGVETCESATRHFQAKGESLAPIVFGYMWAFWAAIFFASATWGDGIIDFGGQVIIFLLFSCAHVADFEPIGSFDEKKKRDRATSLGGYFMRLPWFAFGWTIFVWTFGLLLLVGLYT